MASIVNDQNFQSEVLNSNVPVLVDFFAEWCGPCKAISPIIDELASEYEGKFKVVKLNVDESMETSQKFGVMSIPTMVFFKGGAEVNRLSGARPKDSIKEMIDSVL